MQRELSDKIRKAIEGDILEDLMREDFKAFLWAIWTELKLPFPTRLQLDIADYLANGPRRRMIQAFRGIGKSWITAAFVLWRLWKNPNERILVVSASKDRSDAFSLFCKRLIHDIEWLQHLRPDPSKEQRDSLVAFDVGPSDPHQAPSVRSVGISGQLTGGRATVIVSDDCEVPKNSLTVAMREKLAESVKEFDAVLVPGGEIIYLGTPQCIMSLYNQLPNRGYELRIWPARYPDEKRQAAYQDRLAPLIAKDIRKDPSLPLQCNNRGAPTDPDRFDDQDLIEREASYARSGFALQFMLDTSLSDANKYPLKLSDLIVLDLTSGLAPIQMAWGSGPDQLYPGPEHGGLPVVGLPGDRLYRPMFVHKDFAPFQGVTMAIDPSGRGGDETGYAIVAMLHGMLFTLAMGGLAGGYDEDTLAKLARLAKQWKVNWITIEPNFGDGMFDKLFAPHLMKVGYPCTIDPDPPRSSVQKERRIIDTLEPVMNQHRLVMNASILREDSLTEEVEYQGFWQMTRITRDKGCLVRYDRLDALAMAVGYWADRMDISGTRAVEQYREDQITQALQDFENNIFGRSPKANNWNNAILPGR